VTPFAGPQIRASSDRVFGLVISGFLALVGLWPLVRGEPARLWAASVAAAFLIVALTRAPLLAPLNRVWTRLAVVLHRVMSPVVMGVLFFAVLTPAALIMRLCGRDALRLRTAAGEPSYWQSRPPGPDPSTMTQQF
jgi:hypothetical protein